MADAERKKVDVSVDKVTIKNLAMGGLLGGGGECFVDVKDGKAVRIRPYKYDWKTDFESLRPWTIERDGETLSPLRKALPAPFSLAYKKRTFSPNRIKFPMKRVDWDPNGERNPQNRGKSKYKRITWDEATDIIAAEIRRVHKEYGPLAILAQGDGHGECKTIHTPHGHQARLLDMMGGFTQQVRNPDSWEGWYWGAKHVWGQGFQGMMSPAANLIKDISENADMVLKWGCDEETTPWGFTGQYASRISQFWTRAGIKQVYISPDLNYAAAVHADKWIPVLPNTDAALQLAIIYVWLTEDTWDKAYVTTHAVGMDKISAYVLGEDEEATPKTPEWASKRCGVPEWTIKALARQFAKNTTSIIHYFGGSAFRGPYSHEPGRLECILLGMQGLGGPGVHQCQMTYFGMPRAEGLGSVRFFNPDLPERLTKPCWTTVHAWGPQLIPKTLIQDAILKAPLVFYGSGGQECQTEEQFDRYTYPIAKEKGGVPIHMIWTDTPCRITCWNHGNWTIEAMKDSSIECVVAQHPWLENDCLYADIILPANTTLEVEDIVTTTRQGPHFASVSIQEQSILPIGESKSDYEIVVAIAEKLGYGDQFTGGMSTKDLQKLVFDAMKMDKLTTWEDFYEKKTYVYKTAPDWENDPPGFRKFYEDPKNNPLPTPTGLLEFYSARLAEHFPDDKERPPFPKWVPKGITHDEDLSSERADMFPLLLMSNHPRWRTHAQGDDNSWARETPTGKVLGFDGYKYEPIWINPADAEARCIKDGDVVKIFNERGIVLVGARVWERVMPGVVYVDHGSRHDPLVPGKVDRGGAINTIAPNGLTSKNACGQATSGYLVDVQRVKNEEWEKWRREYPDAFARVYDQGAGLRFDAWIEGGDKMKVFVIDVELCVGCYACQFVCKDEHVGNDWSPIAKPQPDTGQFWMRLDEHIRGTVPKVEMHYVPNPCMHCEEPPCIPPCPIEGAIYKRDDGLVIIDSQKCTGCRLCVDACPYKAIYFNDDLNLAQKCTGCAHLLDGGEWKVPRCADACPTEAIKFGEESDFAAEIAKAEVLKPELGHKPRVYYLNIPKKFVAGTVYDPKAKEIIEGATCTLTGGEGKALTATTDGFGDFWFRGLAESATYKLSIAAKGFKTTTIEDISTEKDVNLGDIALAK